MPLTEVGSHQNNVHIVLSGISKASVHCRHPGASFSLNPGSINSLDMDPGFSLRLPQDDANDEFVIASAAKLRRTLKQCGALFQLSNPVTKLFTGLPRRAIALLAMTCPKFSPLEAQRRDYDKGGCQCLA